MHAVLSRLKYNKRRNTNEKDHLLKFIKRLADKSIFVCSFIFAFISRGRDFLVAAFDLSGRGNGKH